MLNGGQHEEVKTGRGAIDFGAVDNARNATVREALRASAETDNELTV
jgi:hypothetical protein